MEEMGACMTKQWANDAEIGSGDIFETATC